MFFFLKEKEPKRTLVALRAELIIEIAKPQLPVMQ